MADFDSIDIISLHSYSNVRVCISFQVFDYNDHFKSVMFTRVLDLVPGHDVNLSISKDLLNIKE